MASPGNGRGKDKVRMNLWMNRGQYDELKMLAEYEGRTVSDIVRQLVGIHLRDNVASVDRQRKRMEGVKNGV